eukprot:NODE_7762_length_744_cov_177.438003_g7512_i0.p1 GENE.NODE_7762_length_744_cov_177.438003_g7512_i0~~NODE_7762_length_744_cov_177.438003_g7512_i0.p1  ORF type:complete len:177 (-),score=22.49 NODE_7762_length_744_cov_177.438003_g7512_i0:126-656(-)
MSGYGRLVASMHWVYGVPMLISIGCVLKAQDVHPKSKEEYGKWMGRHKSFGLLTAMALIPRLGAKLISKAPRHLPGEPWEHKAATWSHRLLYGFIITMPVTGVGMGWYSGWGIPFFGMKVEGAATPNKKLAGNMYTVHTWVGYYGKMLVPLHVGAAGWHAARGQSVWRRINPFAQK